MATALVITGYYRLGNFSRSKKSRHEQCRLFEMSQNSNKSNEIPKQQLQREWQTSHISAAFNSAVHYLTRAEVDRQTSIKLNFLLHCQLWYKWQLVAKLKIKRRVSGQTHNKQQVSLTISI
eukprot:TRINITY_DN16668_c1_g1_i1.p1 TRINITY_DN16668_c1_g1~~TRINITY_DN16668_c1_g1_i1.p1  ORF type:complete len:121 (+),score=1.07 TRINITY_DN16668_c1_g1_i1:117-479(+)